MRLFVLVFLGLFTTTVATTTLLVGQSIGLHAPGVDWQQINTDTVRVIFPAGYEQQAQRVVNQVHALQRLHTRSIGEQYYKFDLVLQTQTTTPNAYVGLAPFRSEFFTTPPQSFHQLGLTPWNDLLTIHEFRHVQQNSNERRGITRLFSFLQGQFGWAVASGIATPNWFSEGDAVVVETALTTSGRGRLPAFTRGLRAMDLENVRYSYAKTRNGSFKDRVPSHYPYGYIYTMYVRRTNGNDAWKNILADGAAYKHLFYPFSAALRKQTGMNTKELNQCALDDLSKRTAADLATRELITTEQLSPQHPEPAQYFYAHPQSDGSVIAYRSTFRRTPELVQIRDGKTTVLTSIGIQQEAYLDVRDGLAVWTETRQDARYTNRDYSEIMRYEISSGRKQTLTKGGKYLSPSLSFDKKQLVAVEYFPERGARLAILSAANGEEENSLPNPENWYLAWPVFAPDGQTIYALASQDGLLAIVQQKVDGTSVPTALTPFSDEVRDMLNIGEDGRLYYSSNRNGIDNIYAFDPTTQVAELLTNVATGAYYPGISNTGELVFSETNAQGHHLARSTAKPKQADYPATPQLYVLAQPAAWEEEGGNMLKQQFDEVYPVDKFNDYLGGLKLHSWSFNGSYVQPGAGISVDNALNTASFSAEVDYNLNERRTGGGASFRYGGLYPVIELGIRYRERSVLSQDPAFPDSLAGIRSEFSQLALSAGATIPLSWISGDFQYQLQAGLQYSYLNLSGGERNDARLPDRLGDIGTRLGFSALHRQATRQVQPRLGMSSNTAYNFSPGPAQRGRRFLTRNSLYLPGLVMTHGLRIDLDYQRETFLNPYQYPDGMRYVRGYAAPINDEAVRLGVNYQLPLLYPDFGIFGITYFKRIRGLFFYDQGRFGLDVFDRTFAMSSVGTEVYFDNDWLNAQPISVGFQLAYLLERDFFDAGSQWRPQVLISGSF